ncbi:MAG: UvrD-helicase domain-containing protein [Prevotella sp.]|nr:UvrD-helicase domain-containing protein [Prevotella sp.]
MKALTVYKASAGSGKTFTLATEYIRLLVENPTSYRHILAVTFTNKATEEMKMRIQSQLYGISHRLPDSDSYLQHLQRLTGLPAKTIAERAGEALHLLLHNYSYFRVETIDTFFQSVLRNLARELDLTANLRIGLNDAQVEEEAVDQLIDSLTQGDDMLRWLLRYIMETIDDDHSWNIIGQLKQFGKTIFRDYYKEHSSELHAKAADADFFDSYTAQMRQIRQDALTRMQQLGDQFADTLQAEGLTIDDDLLYGKSGVGGFFLKLQAGQLGDDIVGKRVADAAGDATKWCKKTHRRAFEIQALADAQLIPLLRRAMDERPRQWRLAQSATLTLRHLNQLRLLGSIERMVRQLNDDANRFLLSDTQQLLHALISDSDSPFIFEKTGSQLEHIMIDEFQDTSSVQWRNFKVLLRECLSRSSSGNLIVGDVKQSIYRWRSSDWRLLNSIEQEIPDAQQLMDVRTLDTNYRSQRNIILFNNAFFAEAARQEYQQKSEEYPAGAEQLRMAYADVEQQVPASCPAAGLVEISLLPRADYQQQVLGRLADTISMLIAGGAAPGSIAILVRTNNHIPLIADYLGTRLPRLSIISDEAFRLDASVAVNIIVQAMHAITHPADQLALATLAKLYQRTVLGSTVPESQLLSRDVPPDTLLPPQFVGHTDELLRMPLYDLAERLYAIFQLQRLGEQSAYVCAFYDQLSQFIQDNTADVDLFLQQWQDTIGRKTIQSPSADGIRLLSIHKSKGLEFDSVVVPFCDWRLEHADVLWCHPDVEPFSALPILPIDYSEKQMRGTIFEHAYHDEHLQNTVDNLNLLYVAFTRASHNLFVIGRRGAQGTRSALIESVLPQLRLDGSNLEGLEATDDEKEPLHFSYGTLSVASQQPTTNSQQPTANVFMQPVEPLPVRIETFASAPTFRQSNQSRQFVEGDDEESDVPATDNYIRVGSVLHEILSTIRTTADIEPALERLQNDGILYDDDELSRSHLVSMLRKRLEQPMVADWFSGRWQVINESTVLYIDADGRLAERRPDRVMTDGHTTHVVDFKFGRPKAEHTQQVSQYMGLLQQMGMPGIKGWLWYVYSNNIVEVNS